MSQPLTIRFVSDVDSAKKGMASLAASVASNAVSMASTIKAVNDNAAKLSSTMRALPEYGRLALTGLAGLLALKAAIDLVTFATNAARDSLQDMLNVARSAEGAGVSTTFIQGLTSQAKELGLETSKLEGMLTRARDASTMQLGKNGQEATSPVQTWLKDDVTAGNINQGDADRFSGAKTQEDRIRVVLDLIDHLKRRARSSPHLTSRRRCLVPTLRQSSVTASI